MLRRSAQPLPHRRPLPPARHARGSAGELLRNPRALFARGPAPEGHIVIHPAVEAALRRVVDPEMALDIVSLGLIQDVTVEGNAVAVGLTMTSAACPTSELVLDDA